MCDNIKYMKTKKLDIYNDKVTECVNNEYPTPKNAFREPRLQMVVGVRNTGKSYLTSKMLAQAKRDKTFDVVYMITPSFVSNKAYFERFVQPENVYEPTKDSISQVIARVEQDRDEWEKFLQEKKFYDQVQKKLNSQYGMDDNFLLRAYDYGYLHGQKPTYKYNSPVKSLLILDDVLSSPAINQSSGLTKIATLNRHIAPLKENFEGRSACGLSVIILTQTYRAASGVGVSRLLRENLSLLTLFKNKQEKQLEAIREELANVVDVNLFDAAYEYATKEPHSTLTVDFKPKCATMVFRKNLNEVILFDELKCQCHK